LLARLHADAVRTLASTRRSIEWLELALEDAEQAPAEIPVVLKLRGELRVASIRASLASYAEIAPVERELTRALHPSLTGESRGVLWHRCEATGAIDGEPFVELRGQTAHHSGIVVSQLPAARMASAYCESDDAAAVRTYDAIDRWIHRHSLRLDGPKREIYIGQLLEIQFPVRPA
jgi:effector-binding domain-containing protein